MGGFWNREKNTTQTLSDLIRGLQHSVNAAMEMVETRNVELLGRYFSPEGDPLTKRLNIDSQTAVDVPLISIVNPSTVNIKEVEMEFSVQINSSDLRCKQPQKGFQAGDQQTAKYQVHVSARQQQPTEGLSKLMDIMASCVEPVKLGE